MPTVLFDMTPLDTPSRYRGFGRYVRELALGLSKLAASERKGLTLVGLTRLHWSGDCELTEDLASFEGHADIPAPTALDHYREAYKRRVALWRAARIARADLVHLGDPQATPLGKTLAPCKFLVTCHDLIALRFPKQYFTYRDGYGVIGRRLERRRYTGADHVVAISDSTCEDLKRFFGIAPERLTRVYNGVDLERWQRPLTDSDRLARLERLGRKDKQFVLYVGDADWRKNVEGMAAGLAYARSQGALLELVFAGALSEARAQRVDRIAREHGVAAWFHRTGHLGDEDLLALFRSAVATVFVSRAEGFGLPVIESMACGCPVITTRATSLGEVAGNAAWLVDPESPQQIGEALATLAASEEQRQRYRALGFEQAKLFSNERQAREMITLYRRLCPVA